MGANEKHAATYHGVRHDPDLNVVRTVYAGASPVPSYDERAAAFDRMIAKVRAEAKAEALEDFAKVIDAEERDQWIQDGIRRPGAQIVAGRMKVLGKVARTRANQYKEGADNGR